MTVRNMYAAILRSQIELKERNVSKKYLHECLLSHNANDARYFDRHVQTTSALWSFQVDLGLAVCLSIYAVRR